MISEYDVSQETWDEIDRYIVKITDLLYKAKKLTKQERIAVLGLTLIDLSIDDKMNEESFELLLTALREKFKRDKDYD